MPNRVSIPSDREFFPIKTIDGNFLDSEGYFALDLFKVVASRLEREWMSILHTFFSRGHNLEGKSNNGRSPRVHQAFTMLWRKGSKPSFARLNNKVWVPFKVLPVVAISFPPPLPVSEETGSPPDDVQLNHKGSLTFILTINPGLQKFQKKAGIPFLSYVSW